MKFLDRFDAAKRLLKYLLEYKDSKESIIIALPRGGVPLGYVLAKELNLPLDIFFVKKIPSPFNEEVAIGAVSENGKLFLNKEIISLLKISNDYIEVRAKEILQKIKEKREIYNLKNQEIKDKQVILVDDGIATGSTALLAIKALKDIGAKEVIVATPVAPKDSIDMLRGIAEKVIVLISPSDFISVGAYYQDFHQLDDREVIDMLVRVNQW